MKEQIVKIIKVSIQTKVQILKIIKVSIQTKVQSLQIIKVNINKNQKVIVSKIIQNHFSNDFLFGASIIP